ncbi:hypothetical protein AKJ09_00106 [Labilithrix luteola]|uniref:Uncharacterized protein n=2 Tax=Labilithrix luteola TaxID=1391654 RepID=A0A0K1PIU5_9BACT|nr:hypothetical protein AKJ09_00106 [Labilithrix luteola]
MLKYLAALKAKSPVARLLLLDAEEGFRHIVTIAPNSAEASAGMSMHVTTAFTFACDADDELEAQRLYNTMPKADQESLDALDAANPGSMKIWERTSA